MHHIAIGVDESLARDEVRIRMVRYFKDRWPLDEEIAYENVIMNGTLQEMCVHRNNVLNLINEMSRADVRSDAVRDFLTVWEKVPDTMYRSLPNKEREDKTRVLLSFTGKDQKYIWKMIATVADDLISIVPCEDRESGTFREPSNDELCEMSSTFLRWLVKEGFDVNYVHNLRTPLDLLQSAIKKAEADDANDRLESIRAMSKIEKVLLELGAKNLKDYFTDPERLMDRIYPFMKRR